MRKSDTGSVYANIKSVKGLESEVDSSLPLAFAFTFKYKLMEIYSSQKLAIFC